MPPKSAVTPATGQRLTVREVKLVANIFLNERVQDLGRSNVLVANCIGPHHELHSLSLNYK